MTMHVDGGRMDKAEVLNFIWATYIVALVIKMNEDELMKLWICIGISCENSHMDTYEYLIHIITGTIKTRNWCNLVRRANRN